jgi:hypothetical protein
LPKQGLEYVLDTDATEIQLSACLQHRDEYGVLHPVGYWSRQLLPTERRYHITEKEAQAVYWDLKLLRPYLEGNRFKVRTDHSELTWLFNADSNSTLRLTRWRLGLAQFDFIFKYRPVVQHQRADGVSRLVNLGHDSSAVEDEITCCVVADDATREPVPTPGPTLEDAVLEPTTLHELIYAQAQAPFCLSKLSELDKATMKRHFAMNDKGILVRLSPLTTLNAHIPRLSAHPGGTRMYSTLRKSFYWLTMAKDIYKFVSNCPSCAKSRPKNKSRRRNYHKLFPPSQPLEFPSLDILGPLPVTKSGNKYLVVFGDRYPKAMLVSAVPNITTETLARTFVLNWVAVYGIPLLLLIDNGSQIISKFFQTVCRLLAVKQLFTTACNPSSTNGKVEHFNQTVLKSVAQYVSEHQDDWDEISGVSTTKKTYNTTIQSTIGIAPFELILSRVPTPGILQPDIAFGGDPALSSKAVFRQNFLRCVEKMGKAVGETVPIRQQRYKDNYDSNVHRRNT